MTHCMLRRCSVAVSKITETFRKAISIVLAFLVLHSTAFAQQYPLVAQVTRPGQAPVQRPRVEPGEAANAARGVEFYRGLFFASGPFGQSIPTMQKIAPYLPAEYKQLEGPVIAYIQRKDPGFFARFAEQIQSGNHVTVADAINQARVIHKEALLEVTRTQQPEFGNRLRAAIPEANNARTSPEHRKMMRAMEGDKNPEIDTVLAVELAIFLLIFLVITFPAKTTSHPALNGITFDRFVDEVVQRAPRRP